MLLSITCPARSSRSSKHDKAAHSCSVCVACCTAGGVIDAGCRALLVSEKEFDIELEATAWLLGTEGTETRAAGCGSKEGPYRRGSSFEAAQMELASARGSKLSSR